MTVTRQLAEYLGTVKPDDLPAAGLAEMKRLLVDYLGVALAGSRTDTGSIAADFVIETGGVAEATVIGRGDRVPAAQAAFANAVAEHSIELDDVDDLALFHFGPPIYSAVLAVAQVRHASGIETLAAALAGCEMMNRLSNATNPSLRNRGFHTTPTCGVFGAAVGAGRLLGLSPDQLTDALGLAGAQASGLMEMYGTSMQKRLNPAPAARDGVIAALLADRGFTGADTILDGERGFGAAFAGGLDTEKLLAGLGTTLPVQVEYKAYSAARPIHNAVDCALWIRSEHGIGLADIDTIVVDRHPDWAAYHVINAPRTYHEAQVSLPYSTAVAFADGAALPAQYADERIAADRELMAVAERVRVVADPSLNRGVSCRMIVTTVDGRTLTAEVDDPLGSAGNPMTDEDLVDKFRMLTGPILPSDTATEVVERIFAVDELDDINELISLMS